MCCQWFQTKPRNESVIIILIGRWKTENVNNTLCLTGEHIIIKSRKLSEKSFKNTSLYVL